MSTSPPRRRNGVLVAASVLTGVFGALTIYGSAYRVGLEEFAPLATLWTLWALFAASITFGAQQWTIRGLLAGDAVARLRRRLVAASAAGGVVMAAIGATLVDQWFHGHGIFAALAGALVPATAMNGQGRALAVVAGADGTLAGMVVGENLIRLVLLAPLAIVDASAEWYGLALLAGFAVSAFAPTADGSPRPTGGAATTGHSLVVAVLAGGLGYATMFGMPLLLSAADANPEVVSGLFLVVTLARIPFVMALGLLPGIGVQQERLVATGGFATIRGSVVRMSGIGVVGAAVVAAIAIPVAEPTVGAVFRTNDHFGATVYALVGAASVLALVSLVLTITSLALGSTVTLIATWSLPLALAAVGLPVGWFDTAGRAACALLIAEVTVLVVLLVTIAGRCRRMRLAS